MEGDNDYVCIDKFDTQENVYCQVMICCVLSHIIDKNWGRILICKSKILLSKDIAHYWVVTKVYYRSDILKCLKKIDN